MPSVVKLTLESNQYEKGIRQAQKQWNDFMRGMGMSVSKFTAVGAAVGAVSGALKVAKDAFFANENQLDEWGRTVESSKSVYNGFLSAINTGDISGFLSNIDQIVSAARDAYNALDELNTFKAYNQVQDARSRANYAKALDEYKLNPTAENKAALAAANQAVIDNIKAEQTYTMNAYTEALDKLATERGLKGSQRSDFINMFKNKSYNELLTIKNKYDEGKAGRQLYYGDRVLGGKIQNRDTGVWREMEENEKKEFEFARALNQLNDEQIQATQALGKQAEMLDEAVWNQNRAYNRLAGNNAGKGGGSGSGGGGKTTNIKTEQTELQQNQAKINLLTQEYVTLGDITTQQARDRKEAIQQEIHVLDTRNNKLKLYAEQAAGKLQGGWVMKTNLGADSFAKDYLNIGEGLGKDFKLPVTQVESMTEALKQQQTAFNLAGQAANGFSAALSGMEDPAAKAAGQVVSAIASIAMGFAMASSNADTAGTGWGWLAWLAAGASAMATTIATIHSLTGYAEGGIVKGNSYSGDNILANGGTIGLNAGELILNKSQQSTLASQMRDNGGFGDNFHAVLTGENIHIVHSRYLKRTGQGELVTWR